ncbi:MAG: hypothetical protein AB9866_10730 [Syntrophobacteraceae bacterium]
MSETLNYYLFPHLTLSERDFRSLYLFLPRLNLLEILQPASIPEWGRDKISCLPAIGDEQMLSHIKSCVQGYRDFAEIHGANRGSMGFLSQVMAEKLEPRYLIQEELRGKCPPDFYSSHKELLQACVFLEISRELDERELDLESGYAQVDALEKEFRGILGISDEDEAEEAGFTLPLAPDSSGLLFMLPKRMESWFRLLSFHNKDGIPVLIGCHSEVIEQTLELIREGCTKAGKEITTAGFSLGSLPRFEGLGQKQFRSIIDAPETRELLASYWRDLEALVRKSAEVGNREAIETGSDILRRRLETFCRNCDTPGKDHVELRLTVAENVSVADIFQSLGIDAGHGSSSFRNIQAVFLNTQ